MTKHFAPMLLIITIAIACFYGWVANIITLITSNEATGMLIVRAIGIFIFPLGAVLGYI